MPFVETMNIGEEQLASSSQRSRRKPVQKRKKYEPPTKKAKNVKKNK